MRCDQAVPPFKVCGGVRNSALSWPSKPYNVALVAGAPSEPLPVHRVFPVPLAEVQEEKLKCAARSFARKLGYGVAAIAAALPNGAIAQIQTEGPAQPGLSVDSAKNLVSPVTDLLAYPLFWVASLWQYAMAHPPAAVFLSTVIASIVAIVSIRSQRATARLRETFSTIDRGNWDEDLIRSRQDFARIKRALSQSKQSIAKYAEDNDSDDKDAITLQTIMNDYENIALGVRLNIIDEMYLCRWMKGALLRDWNTLSPLVTTYRHKLNNPAVYIEFEGLAAAWSRGRSYRSNRSMRQHHRRVHIK